MTDDRIAGGRAASVCGTKLLNKVKFHTSHCFPLSGCGGYRSLLVLVIAAIGWLLATGVVAQMPLPASSGSGVAFVDLPPHTGIMIRFDYDVLAPRGPMESHYAYDPKTVVVLDNTGKPIDISAIRHRRVDFKAMPNRHPTGDLLDDRMEITKLVLQPPEAQPGGAVQELEKTRQKQGEQMKAIMAQWQQYQEQEKKKKAEEEAAARVKAEREENLRQQMAQKQQESLMAEEEEKKRKGAQAKQKAQEAKTKREQFAGKIVRTKAKIEEEEVAPMGATIKYAVSPHALHVAAATLKGSRAQVLMDGVPGPAFDELLWMNGRKFEPIQQMAGNRIPDETMNVNDAPVVFSEDGKRFAYVGRQGNQFVLMVDGKKAAHGMDIPKHHWTDLGAVESLSFIPGSNRLRYVLTIPKPKELDGFATAYRGTQLVVEGDKDPPLETLHDIPICFSADGQHYTYFADFPPEGSSTQHIAHLVVDGKVDPPEYRVPGYETQSYREGRFEPLFTGDSKHLVTVRRKPLPDACCKGQSMQGPDTVFLDQRPVLEAPFVERSVHCSPQCGGATRSVSKRFYAGVENIWVAPEGTNFIALFAMPSENPLSSTTPSAYRLFFNDRPVVDAAKIGSIAWSPNGKRYSAVCTTKQNSQFMVIDGKKEPEYRSVSNVYQGRQWVSRAFTADSSKSVYLARNDKEFIVVQGEESDGFGSISDLTFSKQGGHFAFVATTETGQKMGKTRDVTASGSQQLVVDGQALEPRQDVHDFMFNPDGTHYAFLSGGGGKDERGAKVVVDGVEQPFAFGGDFVHYTGGYEPDREFLFSPDGKHLLYLASFGRVDASGYSVDHSATKAVCLDGKLIPCEGENSQITASFTPDSKHVMWVDWADNYKVPGYSVYVDGQRDGHYDCPPAEYSHGTTVAAFFEREKSATEMGSDGAFTFLGQVGNAVKKLRVTPAADVNLKRFAALAEERELAAQAEEAQTVQVNR